MMNDLHNDLSFILKRNGIYSDSLNAEIVVALSKYEISEKSTDLIPYTIDSYNTEIVNRFLISKTVSGLTERSLKYYKAQLQFMFCRINKQINMITSDDLKFYLATRKVRDGVSDKTICNDWRVLSSFFGWMLREELIQKNPMFKVEKPKERKMKKKAFSSMEVELLRDACADAREKAIIEVLLSTWCRVSELVQIDRGKIEDKQLTVLGKGKKERVVYLNSKALLAINNYLAERQDDEPALFVSMDMPHSRLSAGWVEKMCRDLGKKAGVDNVHPHRFRRTGATMALRSGMPIEKVSFLLGHESIETTQIYLDIDETEVKRVHEKYVV